MSQATEHVITRRSLVAGLGAAIPATAVAAVPALAGTDPIFALLKDEQRAWDAYGAAIKVDEAKAASPATRGRTPTIRSAIPRRPRFRVLQLSSAESSSGSANTFPK